MSLESHLSELMRRHQALKAEIEENENHPAIDEAVVHELKRKKLALKDEIEKLRTGKEPPTRH